MNLATNELYTSRGSRAEFRASVTFDRMRMRHLVQGDTSVMHCHHYAALFTQLALDAAGFNGPALLADTSADTFGSALRKYYKKHNTIDLCDRIAIAEQYFSFMGLGKIRFECAPEGTTIRMEHSHVDEGWIKKWGTRRTRVNFIGEGFIAGALAAIFDLSTYRMVQVTETQSIVCGARESRFSAEWK